MEKKKKIKIILIAIGSFLASLFFAVLGFIAGRSRKSSNTNTRSYDEYHNDAKSTSDRVGKHIESSRQGIDRANNNIEGIRSTIDNGRERSESLKESIIDVINDPQNRNEDGV